MKPASIRDVAEGHLCAGCGVCASLEPEVITMVNITNRGLRPVVAPGETTRVSTLEACPGAGLRHDFDANDPALVSELQDVWGPVRGIWEGFASDPKIRFEGSSAGAATVLALFCVEQRGMAGVLHIGADPDQPVLNRTQFSTSRREILSATGSRYAPASPGDSLRAIESADAPCVFIGKPCDVAGVQAARRIRPRLDLNLGLTIGLFCAGTPSTLGTLEMLRAMGVEDPEAVREVRYRGRGWPGDASVTMGSGEQRRLSYEASWGAILQKHRQWRCYVCADHTGEFADIAVGDPWYEAPDGIDPGRSLIVARTETGRRIIEAAVQAGVLTATPVSPDTLPMSQPNLAATRGAVWMRIQLLRLFGAYAPTYENFALRKAWVRELTALQRARSITGTVRRIYRKRLRHRDPVRVISNRSEAPV